MLGPTHALVGITTVIAMHKMTNFIQPHPYAGLPTGPVLCLGAAILGSLLPDIDADTSSIQGELGAAGNLISDGLSLFGVKHRGLTHYGITGLLVLLLAVGIGYYLGFLDVGLSFGIGYLSHIGLGDAVTKHGVPLLWPRRFHLLPKPLRIRTGGGVEALIFILLLVVVGFLLPGLFPPETLTHIQRRLRLQ